MSCGDLFLARTLFIYFFGLQRYDFFFEWQNILDLRFDERVEKFFLLFYDKIFGKMI